MHPHGPFFVCKIDAGRGGDEPSQSRCARQLVPLFVAWRERSLSGRTLSVAYGDSSPEGRALGKEGRSRPHLSTAGRSQPISGKLSALAKASPFRERWHGEAVTERVSPALLPLSVITFSNRSRGKIGKSVYPATQKIPGLLSRDFCGGRYRTRTYDLLHVKQMLYQLS